MTCLQHAFEPRRRRPSLSPFTSSLPYLAVAAHFLVGSEDSILAETYADGLFVAQGTPQAPVHVEEVKHPSQGC